ncbi:hypothetical protein [Ornithinimicrobium kibberense]|uniref:hypothetical protein n=1 Tax=Ornithinimicrobium kibberense TaxID=282060 RepID=UPI00361DAE44
MGRPLSRAVMHSGTLLRPSSRHGRLTRWLWHCGREEPGTKPCQFCAPGWRRARRVYGSASPTACMNEATRMRLCMKSISACSTTLMARTWLCRARCSRPWGGALRQQMPGRRQPTSSATRSR